MASTYMGKPYYPAWLDNLADDVTGEGPAWDGAIQGAAAVHEVVVAAKEIYEFQEFHYAGPCGESSFLEDYTSSVRGVPLYVIVLVVFNAAGKAQRLVVNHRPRSSVLVLSRAMFERFAGTPLAKTGKAHPRSGNERSARGRPCGPRRPGPMGRHHIDRCRPRRSQARPGSSRARVTRSRTSASRSTPGGNC